MKTLTIVIHEDLARAIIGMDDIAFGEGMAADTGVEAWDKFVQSVEATFGLMSLEHCSAKVHDAGAANET